MKEQFNKVEVMYKEVENSPIFSTSASCSTLYTEDIEYNFGYQLHLDLKEIHQKER